MKKVKFTYYPEYGGYKCSEPGEGTGTYVILTEAEEEIAALRERQRVLVETFEDIAKQHLESEMGEDIDVDAADYRGAYACIIKVARAALAAKEG